MQNTSDKKQILLAVLVGVAIAVSLFAYMTYAKGKQGPAGAAAPAGQQTIVNGDTPAPPKPEVSLVFAGDIMLGRGVATSVDKNFAGDYNALFQNADYFKNADIAFANLEGPISDRGRNVGSKYSFRFVPDVKYALQNSGLDVLSVANNHAGDWTIDAFADTLMHLADVGITTIGGGANKAEAETVKILEKNGVKVGYIGFTDVGPDWLAAKETETGILLAKDKDFVDIVSRAKSQVDILVVSIHFGEEYLNNTHTKRQETLAKQAIDAGATIVAGHHPHVAEDVEYYKNGLIIYSLGNYIFDQYFSKETMRGLMAFVTVDKNKILRAEFMDNVLNTKYQPESLEPATIKISGTLNEAESQDKGYINEEAPITQQNTGSCEKGNIGLSDLMYLPVGQDISLSTEKYVPDDLQQIDRKYTAGKIICLRKVALDPLVVMIEKAREDGVGITVSSGFRSYYTQKSILDYWLGVSGNAAYMRIAKPAHSEHQLGTTVDLSTPFINNESATDRFEGTDAEKWLEENAAKYGFVRSYPKGKEEFTGYAYEPWHYRYVGADYAQMIRSGNTTLNQFLKNLNPSFN